MATQVTQYVTTSCECGKSVTIPSSKATVTSIIEISCDNPDCGKTATFPQTQEGEATAIQANPWLTSVRFVNLPDNSKFLYCSDECEIKAAGKGSHNKKQIVAPTGPNSVEQAAQAAARAHAATAALKSGEGKVTLE